jgi:cytochrome c oxidase cbb3-type subunit 1
VLLAFACLIVAGKTFDQVMAFHASVGALCAALGVFYIFKNYFNDGGQAIPQELDGKPNYNIRPHQVWGNRGHVLGHRRFHCRS